MNRDRITFREIFKNVGQNVFKTAKTNRKIALFEQIFEFQNQWKNSLKSYTHLSRTFFWEKSQGHPSPLGAVIWELLVIIFRALLI